jgi:EmrB/QacA subfamily drug resistance transporter
VTSQVQSAVRSVSPPQPGRWAALGVIAAAQLLTAVDATIVNIALPTVQRGIGFGDADRQWVVTAYTLTFAGLLLTGGRIADRVGRKRALLGALGGFAAASALAGAAPTFAVLVVGRALQGAFAAVLAPTCLSLVAVLFTDPRERGKAFATYGAVASSGAIVGLMIGGALTQYGDWRWCLYVNVVFALGVLLAGARLLPGIPPFPQAPIAVGSAALATLGLAGLVLGASRAAEHGWADPAVDGAFAAGVVTLALFVAVQRRAERPMLPLRLLASRQRAAAYTAVGAGVVGSFGLSLMLTYHFQAVLGWEPLRTGVAFLPMSAAVAAAGYLVAGRLVRLVAAHWLVGAGLAVAAAGLALITTLTPTSGYWTTVLPAMVLLGAGMGCVFTPAIGIVTHGVAPQDAGIAAAVANVAMQVGSSVGVALLNTVAVIATRDAVAGGSDGRGALVHGYAVAAAAAAAALAAVAVLAVRTLRPAPAPATDQQARHEAEHRAERGAGLAARHEGVAR